MADIFISYTASDRDWAFWIAKELEALKHTPHIHEWEIKNGDDIYAWMESRHDAADHVLCVVSDDYLKAPYSTLERNAALWQAASKRPGFVLFVAVKPCKLPTLADHIRRCELFGVPEEAARIRFREFMTKREAPAIAAFPGKVFAVSNIPISVPTHFMGRDDALAAIATELARYDGRVAITALHGLRGVGKTTLAAAYAERHRGDYRATWWIRARTPDGMRADLVALGVRLGWVAADDKEEPALAAVMERLTHEGEGILLIFDNAVDAAALKPHLPRGGRAQVLVTSNAHAWRGVAAPVEIRLWPKEIGADYFVARTGRAEERDPALALSEALGGLPLAHEQAAAYCERLDLPFAEYAKRFEATPAKFLDDARHAPAEYHDGLTVAKTFALAIDEAAKLHPAAEPLIIHAALLAPEPIPLFLFSEGREKFGEPLATALEGDGLDEAVAALRTFGLIERETISDEREPAITTDCIRLHRLVRQVAAMRCEGEAREQTRSVLVAALATLPPDDKPYYDPTTWPRTRRIEQHALVFVSGDTAPPNAAGERAADLLNLLASYRIGSLGDFPQARSLHERALAIREKVLGPEHRDTGESVNNLARSIRALGDLPKARSLYERALTISEKANGPDHSDTGTCLNNLAFVLQAEGDLTRARLLYERALAISEKAHGPAHPSTAMVLDNLAMLLHAQGDVLRAKSLCERALAINEMALGPNHPETATCLTILARLVQGQGDLAGARSLYERGLAIFEKAIGPDHPTTNHVRTKLAALLLVSNDDGALTLSQAALAAHNKALGATHAWTNDSARVSADALDALGRTDEAKALRERYGIEHESR
jgi:tetratricopeptide (TPR) repeat protein